MMWEGTPRLGARGNISPGGGGLPMGNFNLEPLVGSRVTNVM